MAYAIFILASLLFLIGFFVVTNYEMRRGIRFFAPLRARLDHAVAQVEFVLMHVNLAAFVHDEIRHAAHRIGHDIVHLSLQAVRAIERLLTRLVRYLRPSHTVDTAPRENVRAFVKTLSDFKGQLKAIHPEVTDIQK